MPLPWLGIIDTLIDVTTLVVGRKGRRSADEPESSAVAGRSGGQLEARMTGVVVAALKEAFDREGVEIPIPRQVFYARAETDGLNGEQADVRRLLQRGQKVGEAQDSPETEAGTPSPSGRGLG